MKHFFTLVVAFFVSIGLHAQSDSSQVQPTRKVTFHLFNGINILQNEQLRASYQTKAVYYWGAGIRLGNPVKNLVYFAADYTSSSYKVVSIINYKSVENLLELNQFVLSLSCKMIQVKEFSVRVHGGYIHTIITDSMQQLDRDTYRGAKIGLGFERKLFRNQYVHFNIDYDYMKAQNLGFRDYDVVKLGVGIYL